LRWMKANIPERVVGRPEVIAVDRHAVAADV